MIKAKYGENVHHIYCGDSNRLDLSPILEISDNLAQVVKVPTRLNPEATLDTIITSLSLFYESPFPKPPLAADTEKGKASDHLIVIWRPLQRYLPSPERQYRSVSYRPLTESGLTSFGRWIVQQSWHEVYKCETVDEKVELFHSLLLAQYEKSFPEKKVRVSDDDEPWYTQELKELDRKKKREFFRHQKSAKWRQLQVEYKKKIGIEKSKYYKNMVKDLKNSNPRKWYEKVRRMSGKDSLAKLVEVEELDGVDFDQQAQLIADFYANTRNKFDPINRDDFSEYLQENDLDLSSVLILPSKIEEVMLKMNRNSSTVKGDIPFKVLLEFCQEISLPLTNLFNSIFEQGKYPRRWKRETITPIPKCYPTPQPGGVKKHLRHN